MSKFVTKVEYANVGTSFASVTDLGEIKDDNTHDPALYEDNKNPRGEVLYAGEKNEYNINCYDTAKRAALLTKWKAAERIDVRLTLSDATTVTVLDVLPHVGPIKNSMKAGQRAMFLFKIYKHVE